MKKDSPLRSLFGLTQNEMASLLGISSSHYSMFESGQRDIPLASRHILNELLVHRQSVQGKAKLNVGGGANDLLRAHLEYLLRENEYQSAKLVREIAAVEKKRDKIANLQHLKDFVAATENDSLASVALARVPLAAKSFKSKGFDPVSVLMKMQVRQELLEAEKQYLKTKLVI